MMMRMLVCILAVSSSLTLFGSTERGDRLLQEAGGAIGIAGFAGPSGAPGLAGAAGNQGVQGIIGVPGAPGLLDFSDFFALQGTDNPGLISGGTAINFPRNGSTSGSIVRLSPSTFLLPTIGTYLVQFQVDVTGSAQLQLALNTIPQPTTVVGRSTVTPTQIISVSLVTTTTANSVLEVINPLTNVGLSLPANDGGTNAVSAHLVIVRIQ